MADAVPAVRWYHPTPARLVVGLLALELFLLLSEWLRLFPFNQHKGWTVLIAIAAVGVFVVVMLLWWLAALLFRIRFQFSLRSLFVLTLAFAVPCSWVASEMKRAREQREALRGIGRWSLIFLRYDYQGDAADGCLLSSIPAEPPEPAWLRGLVGDDFFASVVSVYYKPREFAKVEPIGGLSELRMLCLDSTGVADADLRCVAKCTQLQTLYLDKTRVTDAGLEHLNVLTQLQRLYLHDTEVTDAGVAKLQQALPHCEIQR
jgi:hypothetical protein